jgi:site-specific DNA-methyltransferase (adenine-specific)
MEINKIYQGDCLEVLKTFPDESVNLIVTSPPYNKGFWSKNRNMNNGFKTKSRRIEYGVYEDKVNPKEYANNQREVIKECLRVLKKDGSLFYNHIDILSEHQTKHPIWVYDFPVKQVIIWNRKNTPKLDKSYFFPITEYIFWIQKTESSRTKFNRKKSIFNSNVWEISPDVKNKFPAPFPEELVKNCVLTTTDEGDLVLDCYSGSGTTALVCAKSNRNYIGIELNPEYCKIANERLTKLNSGNDGIHPNPKEFGILPTTI